MQVAVTFRHMETDEGVKVYVRDKVQKLQKYILNPTEIHVVLAVKIPAYSRNHYCRERKISQ